MTNEFFDKVQKYGSCDTRKYRYVYCFDNQYGYIIKRIKLEYLDTTAALDSWETIKTGYTIHDFVTDLIYNDHGGTLERMTLKDAAYNLECYKADGWTIPNGITPKKFMKEFNSILENE